MCFDSSMYLHYKFCIKRLTLFTAVTALQRINVKKYMHKVYKKPAVSIIK